MNEIVISTEPNDSVEPPNDTLVFLARAQANKASPEEIEKWLNLHERVTKSQAGKAYTEAMRQCQVEMPVILKDTKNDHTNKRYPKFENILALIKPIYTTAGFALNFGTEESILPDHYRVVCDVRHVGGHSERYHCDFPTDGKGAKGGSSSMNAVQAVGSTLTYARRYLTALIFNLTIADQDTDAARGQAQTEEGKAKLEAKLEAVRTAFDAANLTSEQDAIFWRWAGCTCLADLDPRKYPDAVASLKRKARENGKAVMS